VGSAGVVGGLLFLVVSLMPSLLPRTWVVQGLVTGISFTFGYGIGLLVAWLARHVFRARISRPVHRSTHRVVLVLAAVTVPTMLWLGASWQNDSRRVVHYPTQTRYVYVGVLLVAALTATALIGLARVVRRLYRAVARRRRRWIPPLATRITGAVLVALLVWGVVVGVVGNGWTRCSPPPITARIPTRCSRRQRCGRAVLPRRSVGTRSGSKGAPS
jgi:uncharacterized membrane protein